MAAEGERLDQAPTDEAEVLLLLEDDLSGYISADLDSSDGSDSDKSKSEYAPFVVHIAEPEFLFWRLHSDNEITPCIEPDEHPYFYLDNCYVCGQQDWTGIIYNDGHEEDNNHFVTFLCLDALFEDYSHTSQLILLLHELHHAIDVDEENLLLFCLPPPPTPLNHGPRAPSNHRRARSPDHGTPGPDSGGSQSDPSPGGADRHISKNNSP